MKKTNKPLNKFENFVAGVLVKNFNQHVDADTLRVTAQKVADAVEVSPPKERRSSYTDHASRA